MAGRPRTTNGSTVAHQIYTPWGGVKWSPTIWRGPALMVRTWRFPFVLVMERGSSVAECRTRNQVSPGSNPSLLPFRRLGIFVLSVDAPVDSAV